MLGQHKVPLFIPEALKLKSAYSHGVHYTVHGFPSQLLLPLFVPHDAGERAQTRRIFT